MIWTEKSHYYEPVTFRWLAAAAFVRIVFLDSWRECIEPQGNEYYFQFS
jgi:hypothetical protein